MRVFVLCCFCFVVLHSCKQETKPVITESAKNTVKYAQGLCIVNYTDYTLVTVTKPWPEAQENYRYVLHKKGAKIPDSLANLNRITVPVQRIVVTSTTHIPSLEMLGETATLIGFPNLDYISSETVRKQINQHKVKELGKNQSLNTELLIELQPDVIIGYGIDNNNPTLDNLKKSGLNVVLNGDWNEKTALGKAEWIKLFGALFDKQEEAETLFSKLVNDYHKTLKIAQRATTKPTVLAGDIYEGKWYLPKGNSWGSLLLKDAQSEYLWADTHGTGSLALSFEAVFEKAKDADIWITSGQYKSLAEMTDANPHYNQFKAFQQKNVYSFSGKRGEKGGKLYYELAPNRPDIVIKDLVKILHPELLPGYQPYFFEKLN